MTALLQLENVTKVYRGGLFRRRSTVALEDSHVTIGGERPTILAIAGESGSGKTTMGMLLLGFIGPTEGRVLFGGQNLWQAPKATWQQFRREVQAIFQDPFEVYNPFYKVDHVLTVPIAKFGLAKSRAQERQLVEEALINVGLRPEETLGRYPHQLSGGQRQRITIARALLLNPKVIIADEPVSMIDASLRATILRSLQGLKNDQGISILYITHDLATAYHICEDIMILYLGSVVEAGDVETVITEPEHPYTRLLVGSIPWPDPNRRWGHAEEVAKGKALRMATSGCKFAPRCPHAFEMCHLARPPLYRTAQSRAVACYLYRESPMMEGSAISTVLGVNERGNGSSATRAGL
ncbi:MAG: ABC transporter ATP-binding protein [Chloroflexi bacterium]|nr:ABC transporter ATP-binding protein [Chloroflexota bacterium]